MTTLVFASSLFGQAPNVRLPDETAGLAEIAQTLVSAFDHADVVALCDDRRRKLDSDLRIALVRHPDFAKKVRSIVVEFGSTSEQSTLDRYIRGENVSPYPLAQVWKTTTQAAKESGTRRFMRSFSRPSATSIRGCLPMREFASSGVSPDQETTVARERRRLRSEGAGASEAWQGPGYLWRRALLSDRGRRQRFPF